VIAIPSRLLNEVAWTREAVDFLLARLQASQPKTKVALVVYDLDTVRLAISPTLNYTEIRNAVRRFVEGNIPALFSYDGNFEAAARKIVQTLDEEGAFLDTNTRPHVVFFASSDEVNTVGMRLWRNGAKLVQETGATLFLACPASHDGATEMRKQLENPNLFVDEYGRDAPEKLAETFMDELSRQSALPKISQANIVNELPAMMRYIPGSAQPEPLTVTETVSGTQRLHWSFVDLSAGDRVTVTYQSKPLREGLGEIGGKVVMTETSGAMFTLPFPSRAITVSGLCSPPTATPTASQTPSSTPTQTASPSVTTRPSATHEPAAIYLPLMLKESCIKELRRIDVVMVLDASTSMLEPTSTGRSKLDAALEAALALVDELDFAAGDQGGLIVFNERVMGQVDLSGNRMELAEALAAVTASPGTCIPCGTQAAVDLLFGPNRKPMNTPALVLLTDGFSNVQPIADAIPIARQAKARGAAIFTIGLGESVEEDALRQIASGDDKYIAAIDAETLRSIFQAIVLEIPCPAEHFWGRR
jgi:Mg-chelatase subunit ChlD